MKEVILPTAVAVLLTSPVWADDAQDQAEGQFLAGCLHKQLNAPENQTQAPAKIYRFCACSASYLINSVTPAEMLDAIRAGGPSASITAKVTAAWRVCLSVVKD